MRNSGRKVVEKAEEVLREEENMSLRSVIDESIRQKESRQAAKKDVGRGISEIFAGTQ